MKKVKMIQIEGLEPECPKCRGSNAMLHESRREWVDEMTEDYVERLTCRDCDYSVKEKNVEIEKITMEEAQLRLKKYRTLFILKG